MPNLRDFYLFPYFYSGAKWTKKIRPHLTKKNGWTKTNIYVVNWILIKISLDQIMNEI